MTEYQRHNRVTVTVITDAADDDLFMTLYPGIRALVPNDAHLHWGIVPARCQMCWPTTGPVMEVSRSDAGNQSGPHLHWEIDA